VARLVLRNNYQQTLALSLAERRGLEDLGFQQRMMQILETRQLLGSRVEFLPDDMELTERRRAASRLTGRRSRCCSPMPSSPSTTICWRPRCGRSPISAGAHPLFPARDRGEIPRRAHASPADGARSSSTQLANSMINAAARPWWCGFRQTGATPARIAAAFAGGAQQLRLIALTPRSKASTIWFPASCSSTCSRRAGICCSTASSGSCAMSISARARGRDRALPCRHRTVVGVLDDVLTDAAKRRTPLRRRACGRRRAGGARAPHRGAAVADRAADIVLVADRSGKAGRRRGGEPISRPAPIFQLDRIAAAARGIKVSDYFDRLALDRGSTPSRRRTRIAGRDDEGRRRRDRGGRPNG